MRKPVIISFNQSAIQYGVEPHAEKYMEKYSYINGHAMLYYQFKLTDKIKELPVVPDCCIDLYYACQSLNSYAILYGPVLRGTLMRFEPNIPYFCVRFSPKQSIHLRLFREAVNNQIPLAGLSKDCFEICSLIANEHTFEERIMLFERSILPRIFRTEFRPVNKLIDQSLDYIYRSGGGIAMKDLSKKVGYSARYIRHHFEDYLGISPKLFSRMIRFQNSLALLLGTDIPFSEVIVKQNFYDQSHFLKEFKEFSLSTPSQIRMLRETQLEEVINKN